MTQEWPARVRRLVVVGGAILTATVSAAAWQQGDPILEVASVRLNKELTGSTRVAIHPGGRFVMSSGTPMTLLLNAFPYHTFEIVGAPPRWMSVERYDVTAKATDASLSDVAPLARAILTTRFKLRTHVEVRLMPT